ncbi:Urea transporter [compost metagenome]
MHLISAAVVAGILPAFYDVPTKVITMRLFGYNAVLCAIVFVGYKVKDGVWVVVTIVFSLIVSFIMSAYKVTSLTFPFVAGTSALLILQNIFLKFYSNKIR